MCCFYNLFSRIQFYLFKCNLLFPQENEKEIESITKSLVSHDNSYLFGEKIANTLNFR